jgi:hypothetical protein
MTPNEARAVILTRFRDSYIPVAFADVPSGAQREARYSFDNEATDGGDAVAPASQSWCRFSIQEGGSRQETLGGVGSRRYRRDAVARLAIYCPSGQGTVKADAMVKAFRDLFEGVSFSGVYFTDCQVQELGVEGASWRVDALASFWFEELK